MSILFNCKHNIEIALIEAHDSYRNGYNQHPGGQDEYRYSDAWEHAEAICRLYREELMPVRRIADQFRTTKGTILAILEANGIERRDKSDAWEHAQQTGFLSDRSANLT